MFPASFFPRHYFPGRYFPPNAGGGPVSTGTPERSWTPYGRSGTFVPPPRTATWVPKHRSGVWTSGGAVIP
jgi:hypothetical protein